MTNNLQYQASSHTLDQQYTNKSLKQFYNTLIPTKEKTFTKLILYTTNKSNIRCIFDTRPIIWSLFEISVPPDFNENLSVFCSVFM